MLTSSGTSMPKTPRNTLENSTILFWIKARYVNEERSGRMAVRFVYHCTSLALCSVTAFSHTYYLLCSFCVGVLKECSEIFWSVFYLSCGGFSVNQSELLADLIVGQVSGCCMLEYLTEFIFIIYVMFISSSSDSECCYLKNDLVLGLLRENKTSLSVG